MDVFRMFRFYHIVDVLTVFLICEIAFCKCELKTKTPNHRIKSYEDEFQRNERQAPIDPSRMYLPPRIDSVASKGFGEQIDMSNNFGSDGYGEVGLVQDTFSYSQSAEGSNYGVSTETMKGLNGDQTTRSYDIGTSDGFGRSSSSPNAGYTSLTSRGTNFERLSTINDDYSDIKLPGTNHYGSSLATSSTSNHKSSADGYGQIELLDTSQNTKTLLSNERNAAYSYNQASAGSEEYSNLALNINNQNNPSQNIPQIINNRNYDQNEFNNNRGFQPNGGYNQAFSSGHGQYSNGPEAASSTQPYRQNSYGKSNTVPYSPNTDNIPGINQESSSLGGFNGDRQNQHVSNNYGPTYSQTSMEGRYSNQRSSNAQLNGGYGQGIPNGSNGPSQSQTTTSQIPNTYGPTGFQSTFSNRNNYGPSISALSTNGAYGQGDSQKDQHRPRVGPYNYNFPPPQALPLDRGNSNQNVPRNNGYPQRPSQNSNSSKSYKENVVQNHSNGRNEITTQLGTYSQSRLPECKSYDQTNQHKNGQTSQQNLGQGGSSWTPGYGQETAPNSFPSGANNGPSSSSSITTNFGSETPNQKNHYNFVPKDQYQNSNLLGQNNFVKQKNDIINTPSTSNNNNDFGAPGLNAFSNFAPGNQPNQPNETNDIPSTTNNKNDFGTPGLNAFSNFAPGNQPNQPNETNDIPSTTNNNNDFGTPGLNAFSNFAPGNQPNQPNETNDIPSTTINNNDFGTPGLNAFSNFAPGNQPNEINDIPSTTNSNGNFGAPGPNAFSNFAPGNQPNQTNEINDIPSTTNNNNDFGTPGLNAFSNFAPGNQPNLTNEINDIPSTTNNNNDFGTPGLNAFSNFAPGNIPNQTNEMNDILLTNNSNGDFGAPGSNAFSNFAPGNQPNEINDIPSTTNNNNDFGTPGLNSFSNFAPDNQPNQQSNEINGLPLTTNSNADFSAPGFNAFSNFAHGNLPNQPIDSGNNNCGTSNNGNNIQQTEQVSATSNSGY